MLTRPILIDVAVTPRNDAVSATGAAEVDVDATAAAVVVGAAFLALEQATSEPPTTNSTPTCVAKRERAIYPPFAPGPTGRGIRQSTEGGDFVPCPPTDSP
jgi:hypothetical protein